MPAWWRSCTRLATPYSALSAKRAFGTAALRCEAEEGVATLWLCNARKANPLSLQLMKDMLDELANIQRDGSVRCVVLRHEGPWFSSGHDIHDLFDKTNNWCAHPRSQLEEVFETCSKLNMLLRNLSKPTVAIVQGHASAGGAQLVASCDIVLAAEASAAFSAPGSQRGRFCHTPGVAISEKVGATKALELLLLGSTWSAEEAKQAGLVNFVFSEEELVGPIADFLFMRFLI